MDNSEPVPHPWHRLRREAFRLSEHFTFYKDRLQIQANAEIDYFYVERPVSATIVATTYDNCIILIRQYRYPVDAWCWELPAGSIIPGTDQSLEDAARRELREETGANCRHLQEIGRFYVASHLANECTHVFLGTGATIGQNQPEPSEVLEVRLVPVLEALGMAKRGEITDGPSALALLLAEQWL